MAENGYYYSINDFPGNGTQTTFEVSFAGGYISRSHITARLFKDSDKTFVDIAFTWINDYTIRMSTAPQVGYTLRVYRTTPIERPLVDYSDGALLSEVNLDTANRQAVFAAQEAVDAFGTVPGNDVLRDAITALGFATNRTNHVGTQAIATVSGLVDALAAKLTPAQLATGDIALGIKGRGPSIVRSVQQLADEGLDLVKDYGAVGNATVNNAAALTMAFDDAISNGFDLSIPAGRFNFDTPINVQLVASLFNSQRGASIRGVGPASRLIFTGLTTADAVTITGTHPGLDKFVIDGLGIHRPNTPLSNLTGAGLRLRKMVGAEVRNLSMYNHGIGLALDGVLASNFTGVAISYCRRAGLFDYFNISGPNVLNFIGSKFTSNDDGVEIRQGCSLNFMGCTFEGTGADKWVAAVAANNEANKLAAVNSAALRLVNCGREGGQVLAVPNCYFEGGRGYDVDIQHGDFSGRYEFRGALFNRFTEPTRTTYDRPIINFNDALAVAGNGPGNDAIVDLNGAAVRRYGTGGTVAIPDPTTPFLKIDTASSWPRLTVLERDVLYSSSGNNNNPNWQTTSERTAYGSRDVRREGQLVTPAMQNGWVANIDPALRITRSLDGVVRFEGAVRSGATGDASEILRLPAGFRPTRTIEFACSAQTGPCRVRVEPTAGVVQLFGAVGAGIVYLNGISFSNV